jgi:hypothetical protein
MTISQQRYRFCYKKKTEKISSKKSSLTATKIVTMISD